MLIFLHETPHNLPITIILNHVVFQANASVQVDAADRFGILVTNGEFTAFVDPKFGTEV